MSFDNGDRSKARKYAFSFDLVPLRSSLINNVIHTTELMMTSMKKTLKSQKRSQRRRARKRKNPKKSPEGRPNPNSLVKSGAN